MIKKNILFFIASLYLLLLGIGALGGGHFHNVASETSCPDTEHHDFYNSDNSQYQCCIQCCTWEVLLYHIFEKSIYYNNGNSGKENRKIYVLHYELLFPFQALNAIKFLQTNSKCIIPKDLSGISIRSERSPPVSS